MNILIIGGTRFIGLEVSRQLTEAGHTLTLYHRTPISSLPYKQMQGDLCDSNTLRLVISKVSPDCIIHMNLMEKKHIEALESALTKKTRVVIVSSVDVYKAFEVLNKLTDSPVQEVPLSENSPLRNFLYFYKAKGDYYEKIDVEKAALESHLIVPVILRLGMVYGKNDPLRRFQDKIDIIRNSTQITLPENIAHWIPCYSGVKNIAHGIILAAEKSLEADVFNLADAKALNELDWHIKLADLLGWQGKIKISPNNSEVCNYNQHIYVDSSKIRQKLGYYELYSIEEHLRDIIDEG